MKITKNFTFVLTLIASVIFFSTSIFAQEDPVKNQEQNQVKTQVQSQDQNQVKNQEQIKSQGDPQTQLKNQTQTQTQQKSKNQVKTQTKEQNQVHGAGFVDLNGDGINDNAVDSDGDGIPNGQDPDYTKPQDGTGQQNKNLIKPPCLEQSHNKTVDHLPNGDGKGEYRVQEYLPEIMSPQCDGFDIKCNGQAIGDTVQLGLVLNGS